METFSWFGYLLTSVPFHCSVEGISSLWSGLSPTLVLAVPTTVVYFTSYEQLKHKLYDLNLIPNYRHRYVI